MRHLSSIASVVLAVAALAPGARGQTPSAWRAQQLAAMEASDAIMQRATAQRDLLAQYQVMRRAYASDKDPAFRLIFGQYLSWFQSFIGDYRDAELSFSIDQKPVPHDAPSPVAEPGWRAVPALDAIPALAKGHRVVFVNEAHNIALTRTLTVRLLKPLRAEGFNVFAVETLYPADVDALNRRGYPIAASGFYTREPVYAEMVRTALRLGYRVVAYEADARHTGDAREAQQARNLWQILKADPHARLLVNAGYAHIRKTGEFLGAQSMAEHFVKDSGIEPLSIEQTFLIPHQDRRMDYPYYGAIIDALHPTQPIVFLDQAGKPWSLRAGYDASVVFPGEHFVRDRPTWLALWGARVPVGIDGNICRRHWPCMVAARYADEGSDAIPADRMVLDPVPLTIINDIKITRGDYSIPAGDLYLRPGYRYRVTVSDERGQRIGTQTLDVKAANPQPAAAGSATTPGDTRAGTL
jgi:hypothetical protein